MMVKKEILVEGRKAILSYDDTMFGKDANTLDVEGYTNAEIMFLDGSMKIVLMINGEEYYSDSKDKYINDFYFEVVDVNSEGVEMSFSEPIYFGVTSVVDLVQLLIFNSSFRDYKICPKGFVAGYCNEDASKICEYSASGRDGLCGAECQDCLGEMMACDNSKGYVCECSTILFEDRHRN